jgi:hypothetical protein
MLQSHAIKVHTRKRERIVYHNHVDSLVQHQEKGFLDGVEFEVFQFFLHLRTLCKNQTKTLKILHTETHLLHPCRQIFNLNRRKPKNQNDKPSLLSEIIRSRLHSLTLIKNFSFCKKASKHATQGTVCCRANASLCSKPLQMLTCVGERSKLSLFSAVSPSVER